jgi:23S rRNA maturation-related 3'-5' exoribonuclease YhaM
LKEQQRKREVESYEYRINELISSVGRHSDLAKMWEVRCQEQ